MLNYCAKHQQFYSDYCVYCGNPQEKRIVQTNAGYNTSNTADCICDKSKTYNDCVIHGKSVKGQNPLAS